MCDRACAMSGSDVPEKCAMKGPVVSLAVAGGRPTHSSLRKVVSGCVKLTALNVNCKDAEINQSVFVTA